MHRGAALGLAEVCASSSVVTVFVVAAAQLDACVRLDVAAMVPLIVLASLVLVAHARVCLMYTRLLRDATLALTSSGVLSTHPFSMLVATLDVRSRILYIVAAVMYAILVSVLQALSCVGAAAAIMAILLVALEVAAYVIDARRLRRKLATLDVQDAYKASGVAALDDDDDDDGGDDHWYPSVYAPARAALEAERAALDVDASGGLRAPAPSAERVFIDGVAVAERVESSSSSSSSSDDDDDNDAAWSIIESAPQRARRVETSEPTYARVPSAEELATKAQGTTLTGAAPAKPPRAKDKDA